MNVRNGFRNLTGTVLVTLAAPVIGVAQESSTSAGAGQLRWTPHRVASTPQDSAREQPAVPPAPRAVIAPPAPSTPAPVTAPATVSLPANVSVDAGSATPGFAPLRRSLPRGFGDWMSSNRIAGTPQAAALSDPDSILGVPVFRAPQGERGRPVLAAEKMPRRKAGSPAPTYGGGDAPRFDPAAQASPPTRQRIAMNVDGIPSVMTRGPQAAALDDGTVSGRLPAAVQPPSSQTLPSPAPAAATPSKAFEIDMGAMPPEMIGMPAEGGFDPGMAGGPMGSDTEMWAGQYPAQVHVESFYDDPYACEDGEDCCLPIWEHEGRLCAWMRRFGRPYYGWKWYRDFTASAGVTSFTNPTNLGLAGNYGVNEYLNWAMPFWNAFGIGWQLGVRGVQSSFQPATINVGAQSLSVGARDQVFVTTGFFTRAFEGRGLQGGAVYDYLSDGWFADVNVTQIRSELSYVWGYHEIGYWGAQNLSEQFAIFTSGRTSHVTGTSVDLYTAFYRLHFGDANEWRVWGGASGNGDGIIGSSMRSPMSRSLALEGTFTYLIPKQTQQGQITDLGTTVTYAPAAWNVSVNLVYYPAGRSRRSLASPYRPLFDVADNGSLIRSLVLPKR